MIIRKMLDCIIGFALRSGCAVLDDAVLFCEPPSQRVSNMARYMQCKIPLLAYHRISQKKSPNLAPLCVSPGLFKEHMRVLRDRGYYSISVPDWAFCVVTGRHLPGRPVAITFDDGYMDFMTDAWPILKEMDFRATVFVVTSRVGTVANWDREADPPALMGWNELRAL